MDQVWNQQEAWNSTCVSFLCVTCHATLLVVWVQQSDALWFQVENSLLSIQVLQQPDKSQTPPAVDFRLQFSSWYSSQKPISQLVLSLWSKWERVMSYKCYRVVCYFWQHFSKNNAGTYFTGSQNGLFGRDLKCPQPHPCCGLFPPPTSSGCPEPRSPAGMGRLRFSAQQHKELGKEFLPDKRSKSDLF